jgi:hypothetical protein
MNQRPSSAEHIMERWDELELWQQIYIVGLVWFEAGGVRQTLTVLSVALVSGAVVLSASLSWVLALALGLLAGWVLNELLRISRKK